MHIFITGIAGFLGSNLADYYIKKNYKVSGCDNLIGGSLENIHKKVKFYKADIEDFNKLNQILKNVDIVCHAAAYAHEGLSNFSPFRPSVKQIRPGEYSLNNHFCFVF